jgi:DNA-binding MarR family transcriptional regulator
MNYMNGIIHSKRNIARVRLEPLGISPGQPPVLKYLMDHDGSIQKDIAANCKVKAATVVSVLDGMERSGWVKRIPLEGDRRAWQIFLTEQGREICLAVDEIFRQLDECFLDGVTETELLRFRDTLNKISANIQKMEGDDGTNP